MSLKYKNLEDYLVSFLKEETFKTSLKGGVLGLSGGIDSAVVALLAKKAYGNSLKAILLPSQFSSQSSIDDAQDLCKKFDIKYEIINIKPLIDGYSENKNSTNLRVGNFSARVRMSILFDQSAKYNYLVLGTSNKSELMLGYGTWYGDLASAINPIGDIYKSEIFEFASYLGVTKNIIDKPPSADLWSGQSDEEELGYSYEEIDKVLFELVDSRVSTSEVIDRGFDRDLVYKLDSMIYKNQFKRKTPIIAKVSNRTIGVDFLYPRDIKL
jgi:NAD+ synthase